MNEARIYRKALEMLKSRIDLFGEDINPGADDMRFVYTSMQRIIDNALTQGEMVRKNYNKVITVSPEKNK